MENKKNEGWVSIYRQIRKHPIWTMERFTYGQAWVDLILRANHCNREIPYNGQIVTVERGWMLTSKVKLAEEWQWNVKTVDKYLKKLQKLKMIRVKSDRTGTWIFLVNYDKHQSLAERSMEKPMENPMEKPMENPMEKFMDTNNKGNNSNKKNNKAKSGCSSNSFNNFQQRGYDFVSLEERLLKRK